MKTCQEQQQHNHNKLSIIFLTAMIFIVTIMSLSIPNIVNAQSTPKGNCDDFAGPVQPGFVLVYSPAGCKTVRQGFVKGLMNDIKNFAKKVASVKAKDALKSAAAIAYKTALGNFLNNLAYDTATYWATNDKGQNPMFETDSIGDYISKAGDSAAGTFLETLGKNGYMDFNLCEPSLAVKLKINLGLLKYERPKKPDCTASKMLKNWKKEGKRIGQDLTDVQKGDFLNKFQDIFNPWSNDLGIALSLQTGIAETKSKEQKSSGMDYTVRQGVKAVKTKIRDKITTPATLVDAQGKKVINQDSGNYFVYTGNAIADAVGVFTETLAGKVLEKWLKKGLVSNFPDNSFDWSNLENSSSGGKSGIAGAKKRFKR